VTVAGGAEKVLHFGSKTTEDVYLDLSFANGANQYELRLRPTADDGLYPSFECASASIGKENHQAVFLPEKQGREAGISNRHVLPVAQMV